MTSMQAEELIATMQAVEYLAGRLEQWLMFLVGMALVVAGYRLISFFMRERSGLISSQ